jgi:hypothetical protein
MSLLYPSRHSAGQDIETEEEDNEKKVRRRNR